VQAAKSIWRNPVALAIFGGALAAAGAWHWWKRRRR